MEPADETSRCANQVRAKGFEGSVEPTQVCSCAAGLIHMHDCPVTLGLQCQHFHAGESAPIAAAEAEQVHERLMQDYLSRPYFHRVRSLAPAGDPWQRRREELYAFYATVELEGTEPHEDDEAYEREREHLIAQRKERERERQERDDKSREERAKERARHGIKTVVERAQDAVASTGNIASSVVDDLELPASKPRRRRRRRRDGGGGGPEGGGGQGAAPSGTGAPRKRRRRRRRRSRGEGGPPSA